MFVMLSLTKILMSFINDLALQWFTFAKAHVFFVCARFASRFTSISSPVFKANWFSNLKVIHAIRWLIETLKSKYLHRNVFALKIFIKSWMLIELIWLIIIKIIPIKWQSNPKNKKSPKTPFHRVYGISSNPLFFAGFMSDARIMA